MSRYRLKQLLAVSIVLASLLFGSDLVDRLATVNVGVGTQRVSIEFAGAHRADVDLVCYCVISRLPDCPAGVNDCVGYWLESELDWTAAEASETDWIVPVTCSERTSSFSSSVLERSVPAYLFLQIIMRDGSERRIAAPLSWPLRPIAITPESDQK